MRPIRLRPGSLPPAEALGAVLVRDVVIGGERWAKGRRLSAADLSRIAEPGIALDLGRRGGETGAAPGFTALVLEPDEVHEDAAAIRLAEAVAGSGLRLRGPSESRIDLLAEARGVLRVRSAMLERLDRIDPLAVFTLYDGQVVERGELVASVKIGPHAVPEATLVRGLRLAAKAGPLVWVAPFQPRRVAVLVKESLRPLERERFERGIAGRVEWLGSSLEAVRYVEDDAAAVERSLGALVRGPQRADLVLTAGAASTDPTDALFVALERLGGRVVRHGVPAHPGSMVWLARVRSTDLLGLPSCGAYARATAADLLLPRLLSGERVSAKMAASLGHGGVLVRAMRFRFPPYARQQEAGRRAAR
ncbi:MAG: molybdopterin-binding protein [Candidatus Limnocylindrales bacterium]